MKFYYKCNETAQICDRHQYKEASLLESVRMKLHLFLCTICREYSRKNGKLTRTIKSANIKRLPSEEKELLRSKLSQEINDQSIN